jgi:hypothetical protein
VVAWLAPVTQVLFEQVRGVSVPLSLPVVGQAPAPGPQVPVQVVVLPQSVPLRAVTASAGQVGEVPSQRSGASQVPVDGRHSTVLPEMLQVPTLPARLHTWQSIAPLPQAVLQHTPSTQVPLTHSTPAPQVVPLGFFAAHSVPEHHVVLGQPAEHGIGQSTAVPLQLTMTPHGGSPGSPIGEGRQVPMKPGRSQRSQEPEHALPQHTPFAQTPEVHWKPWVQACPLLRVTRQVPWSQKVPAAHWRAELHVVGQMACPSQTKGAQLEAVPSGSTAHWP